VFEFETVLSPEQISPLTLAFVGDAVYEVYVRTMVAAGSKASAGVLHRTAVRYVCAGAQSAAVDALCDKLTEQELTIYKRGRNAHPHTSAKNADIVDYRRATGLEALVGYLYLKKDFTRLEEIMRLAFESCEKPENA